MDSVAAMLSAPAVALVVVLVLAVEDAEAPLLDCISSSIFLTSASSFANVPSDWLELDDAVLEADAELALLAPCGGPPGGGPPGGGGPGGGPDGPASAPAVPLADAEDELVSLWEEAEL